MRKRDALEILPGWGDIQVMMENDIGIEVKDEDAQHILDWFASFMTDEEDLGDEENEQNN